MGKLKNIGFLLILLFCLDSITAIYIIPSEKEHSSNHLDTLEIKRNAIKEENIQYPTLSASPAAPLDSADGNGQTHNAIIAKTSPQQRLRHHTSYDKNDDVVVVVNEENQKINNNDDENDFENSMSKHHTDDDAGERNLPIDGSQSHSRQRRELSDWLIAPNTRWCGKGNSANGTYNHLGGASRADKCCRKHDHCKLFIPAMSNRFGLFNYRPYTMSHCNCDTRFRTCLKMAGDEDANTIGKLFFNMVDTQCFVLSKERVCLRRTADGSCEQEHIKKKAYLRNNRRF